MIATSCPDSTPRGAGVVVLARALALAAALPLTASARLVAQDAAPSSAAEVAEGRRLAREGVEAYRAGDLSTFASRMAAAVAARPDHPVYVYNLAAARSLVGDTAGAVTRLSQLEAWGLSYDLRADTDFDPLRGVPAFEEQQIRLLENGRAFGDAERAWTLDDPQMIPEGLAWDRVSGRVFVSGVRRRVVLAIEPGGAVSTLIDGLADGMPPPLGLGVDAARRALWVSGTRVPESLTGPAEVSAPEAEVREYDLDTGALRRRIALPPIAGVAAGDVAVEPDGDVLVSDWRSGALLRAVPDSDTLAVVLPPGSLGSPQGIAPAVDGSGAWVADYALGLAWVDFATGSVSVARVWTTLLGSDAVAAHGDALLIVQNGVTPARVLRVAVGAGGEIGEVEVVLAAHPDFSEPTGLAVIDGAPHVIANGQWPHFAGGEVQREEELTAPLVLRLRGRDASGPSR